MTPSAKQVVDAVPHNGGASSDPPCPTGEDARIWTLLHPDDQRLLSKIVNEKGELSFYGHYDGLDRRTENALERWQQLKTEFQYRDRFQRKKIESDRKRKEERIGERVRSQFKIERLQREPPCPCGQTAILQAVNAALSVGKRAQRALNVIDREITSDWEHTVDDAIWQFCEIINNYGLKLDTPFGRRTLLGELLDRLRNNGRIDVTRHGQGPDEEQEKADSKEDCADSYETEAKAVLVAKAAIQYIHRCCDIFWGERAFARPKNDLATIYYHNAKHCFYGEQADGNWQSFTTERLRMKLLECDFSAKSFGGLAEVDVEINRIVAENGIDFAGVFAGYARGVHVHAGRRFLATHTFELTSPTPGEWPTINALSKGLLGEDQAERLMACLKRDFEILQNSGLDNGQAVFMVGPPNCGKSFLLNHVVVPLLGGRSGNAYEYLTRQTTFNDDMIGAEVLVVDDEQPLQTYTARRAFASAVKKHVAAENHFCHPKGQPGFSFPLFRRLYVCINDEDIEALPLIDSTLLDKVIVFKARVFSWPEGMAWPTNKEEKEAFRQRIRTELPAFIDYLLKWQVPEKLVGQRFGVESYQHPEVMEALAALAPHQITWELVQEVLFGHATEMPEDKLREKWDGTALELWVELLKSPLQRQVEHVIRNHSALGTQLGLLAKDKPNQIAYHRTEERRWWSIKREG